MHERGPNQEQKNTVHTGSVSMMTFRLPAIVFDLLDNLVQVLCRVVVVEYKERCDKIWPKVGNIPGYLSRSPAVHI